MIGWNLDEMSNRELAEKYDALVRAQSDSDRFPELMRNLKLMSNYLLREKRIGKLPTIMSEGMKI